MSVPSFRSDAKELGVGSLFAAALRRELATLGVRIVSRGEADLIATGKIGNITESGMAFPTASDGGLVRVGEFRTSTTARVRFRKPDGTVLLDSGPLSIDGEYLRGVDVLGTEANRRRTLRQIATDIARRVAQMLRDAF